MIGGKISGDTVAGSERPAARPLLSGAARPLAVAVVVGCVLVVAAQAVWIRHGMETTGVDVAVDASLRATLSGHRLMLAVLIWAGEPVPVALMTTAMALMCLVRRRYREAALVAISVPVASALTELVLKPLVGGTPWGNPFPSGHVTCAAALAAALAVVLARAPAVPRVPRLVITGAALLVVAAVAVGVIGANMHHFADVIGGAAVGAGTVLTTALVLDLLYGRGSSPPA